MSTSRKRLITIILAIAAGGGVCLLVYNISAGESDTAALIDKLRKDPRTYHRDNMGRDLVSPALNQIVEKGTEALPEVVLLLEDPSPDIRLAGLSIIGAISLIHDDRTALENVTALLGREGNAEVVTTAMGCLGALRSREALEVIIPFLDHQSPNVRMAAVAQINHYTSCPLGNLPEYSVNNVSGYDAVVPSIKSWWNDVRDRLAWNGSEGRFVVPEPQ